MNQRFENDYIAELIIKRIKFDFKDDISIFACCGSVNRDYYIVPKTKRGNLLVKSFLLNSLGCDLQLLTWDRVDEIASCNTSSTHTVADSRVLFYSENSDLERFNISKESIYRTLNHKTKNRMICTKRLRSIKKNFFDIIHYGKEFNWDIKIVSFLEEYLILLATLNKTYVHRGLEDFKNEITNYKFKPLDLQDKIVKVLNCVETEEVKSVIKSLLFDLIDLIPGSINSFTNFKPEELEKIFNRVRPLYNKLEKEGDANNIDGLMDVVRLLDEKTKKLRVDGILIEEFPILSDFEDIDSIEKMAVKHSKILEEEYKLFKASIEEFESFKDLNSPFI